MVDPEIMAENPLEVRYPPVNFIKIRNTSDTVGDSRGDGKGLEGPRDEENLLMDVEEDRGENPFKIDIREVSHGFSIPKILVINSKMVDKYSNKLKACV